MKYYNFVSGGLTPDHLLAALTFAALGWFVYKTVTASQRKIQRVRKTPEKWSWKFWIKDNWKEAVQHMVLMFVLVRFAADILPRMNPQLGEWMNSEDQMWLPFLVGVLKAYVLDYFKKKSVTKV